MIVLMIFALPVYSSGEGISEITETGLSASELPVTRVTLYTAGLAQMVHESSVFDDKVIYFPVAPGDINDILKSLVVEDLDGGTVDVVNFDSIDPLSVTLGNLRVSPSGSPSITDFLYRSQGEFVAVSTVSGEFEGRIFSIETRQQDEENKIILNLMNNSGIISVEITDMKNLRFIDPMLQNELLTALGKIADARVKSVRTLKISFRGSGERRIRLSYIRAVPLWKTSYRIVLDEDGIPRLEGWAIVQNTGSDDWKNVQLGFVAGQPNAFTMDLSTPRYVTRQAVGTAATRPIGPTSYNKASAPEPSAAMSRAYSEMPSMDFGGGMDDGMLDFAGEESYTPPPVQAQASGTRGGNFYRYDVKHPVTVDGRSSAMIPIIQQEEAGSSVGVYDPGYNLVFKGIRLKNNSEAQWAAGPVTVLDGRYYGGDALLPEMIPGSSRLITYAVHGTVEVEKSITAHPQRITALKISDGILHRIDKIKRETVYRIEGKEDELLIIHPRNRGWELTESPEISEENTGEYRFIITEWDKPVTVSEEYIISNEYGLIGFQITDFNYYMEWDGITEEMKLAMKKAAGLKRELESIRSRMQILNNRVNQIYRDQGRIRENMKTLDKESDLFIRYSNQLTAQEEELEEITVKQTAEQRKLDAADKALKDYIAALDIE